MNFHQIRAFHLVAREGSVWRAAELMGVTQPTVSQHLKALEAAHAVRLFEKRGRGLVLTEFGKELRNVTARFIEAADDVEEILRQTRPNARGRLRVVSDSPHIAVRIVRRMLVVHPELDVTIRKDSSDGVVSALNEMRADVGIAVDPPIGASLETWPFREEHLYACLSARSPLARKGAFSMEMIAGQTLVLREQGSRTRALAERLMRSEEVEPQRIIELDGGEVVREAVALRLGLAFFSESECPPDPRLRYAPVRAIRGQTSFVEHLLLRRDRRRVPEIRAFVEAANFEREHATATKGSYFGGEE
ncbi:LysR family transcriptional regulator [Salipiger pacificus]|nr:LysR family transcriptional regulator [Alloyangia pacifica]MCA0948199.1 LysR family transcriptional regulator [Alloyangia pacifica]